MSAGSAALQTYARSLRALADVPSRASADAAARLSRLIRREFSAGSDPYGRAWAPLAPATLRKGRRPPPLTASGAMRNGVQVRPMRGKGIAITVDAHYAAFHQTGTRYMPARPLLPTNTLPATWRAEIDSATQAAFKHAMGGR